MTIQVLDGVAGKEGFDAMIRMCSAEQVKLRAIGWNLLVFNRHAYAFNQHPDLRRARPQERA